MVIIALTIAAIGVGFGQYHFQPTLTFNRAVVILDDSDDKWAVIMNFTSTGIFAAQIPLDVDIIAYPLLNDTSYDDPAIIFQDSVATPTIYVQGIAAGATEILVKHPTYPFAFKGHVDDLIYPDGGEKCVIVDTLRKNATQISDNQVAGVYSRRCVPIVSATGNDTAPNITISDLDTKYQYETNRATLLLGWIIVGLTLLLSRDIVKGFVKDYGKSTKKPAKQPDEPTGPPTSSDQKDQSKKEQSKSK